MMFNATFFPWEEGQFLAQNVMLDELTFVKYTKYAHYCLGV